MCVVGATCVACATCVVCACVCARVRVRARACARACVRVHGWACACALACVCTCVRTCVACVRACGCVRSCVRLAGLRARVRACVRVRGFVGSRIIQHAFEQIDRPWLKARQGFQAMPADMGVCAHGHIAGILQRQVLVRECMCEVLHVRLLARVNPVLPGV